MVPRWMLAAGLLASVAAAEQPAGVPDGWVKQESIGKLRFWTPSKDTMAGTAKTEFGVKAREIYGSLEAVFGLKAAVVRAGDDASKFPAVERSFVDVLLFADDAAYDRWLLEDGKSIATVHEGHPLSVVGFPLAGGTVPKERWPEFWHLLSHVFIHHLFYFEPPLWLNEGLAEYLSYSSKKARPTEYPAFNERIGRLKTAYEQGELVWPEKLFERRRQALTPIETDCAWLLVHMLLTQAPGVFSDMTRAMVSLESMAVEGQEGILNDLHKLCRTLLEAAFDTPADLSDTYVAYLKGLVRSPTLPPRLAKAPKKIDSAVPIFEVDFNALWPPPGGTPGHMQMSGEFQPRLPWSGRVTINGCFVSSKGVEGKLFGLVKSEHDDGYKAVTWKNVECTNDGTARDIRVVVSWVPKGGGMYRRTVEKRVGKK